MKIVKSKKMSNICANILLEAQILCANNLFHGKSPKYLHFGFIVFLSCISMAPKHATTIKYSLAKVENILDNFHYKK